MSANRILKKRKQQAQTSLDSQTAEGSQQPHFLPQHPKMSQQEAKRQQQFEAYAQYSQYNPSSYQFTNTHLPCDNALFNRQRLPIGICVSPVSYEMEPVQKSIDNIPRCGSCRAYMNYYNEIKKNSFICFVCNRENSFMGNTYDANPENVELMYPSYHVLGGQNIYLQSPPEKAFIFMIDISNSAFKQKVLYYFISALKEVLSREDLNQTQIYFFTYDEVVHEYDFSGSEVKCTVFDPSISNSEARAFHQNFLHDIRQKLFNLLDTLEQLSEHNKKQGSNFLQAFNYVYESIKHTGGKMFILQSNQAIAGQAFMNQHLKNANNQIEQRPKSFLQTKNKVFFNKYVQSMLESNISFSLFVFAKNYKNIRIFSDTAKLTNSEIFLYKKQVPEDLTKFYYDLSYLLGCTYYDDVRMELLVSPGWVFTAVYGNLYRIKEFVQFKYLHLQPSKRTIICLQPQQINQLPYFALQIITNYIYNRQHFVAINTVVLPLTTNIEKIYSSQDYSLTAALMSRSWLSSLRLEEINNLRNKFLKNLAIILKCANEFYKKKLTPEFNNFLLSQLAFLKSQHFQIESINDTFALDIIVSQRTVLQSCNLPDLQNFFSPYLFSLSTMTKQMCQDEQNFIYPQICELKFQSVKQGIYLLDNGLTIYLYISKVCDPNLLKMLFGKEKFTKAEHLSEDSILTSNRFGQQVTNLIRVIREQKSYGWLPLYVVRCGEGSMNERNFYMNFYAQKYEEFRNFKLNLSQFIATLSQQF